MQIQDSFVHKKMLYKFDKKIQTLFQSLFMLSQSKNFGNNEKMIDQNDQNEKKTKYLSKQAILQQIQQLKFQNFKYRTALISAQKDKSSNQQILKKAQEQIIQSKREVQKLSRQVEHSLRCKRNKEEYNQLAESLKSSFEPLSVQNQKLSTINKEIQQMEKKYQKQVSQYQKKQKCLRLALSALKCVIESQETESDQVNSVNGALYQEPIKVSEPKMSQQIANQAVNSATWNGQINTPSREQGQQLEGGQIQY